MTGILPAAAIARPSDFLFVRLIVRALPECLSGTADNRTGLPAKATRDALFDGAHFLKTQVSGYILSAANQILPARTGNISLTPQIWGSQKNDFSEFHRSAKK